MLLLPRSALLAENMQSSSKSTACLGHVKLCTTLAAAVVHKKMSQFGVTGKLVGIIITCRFRWLFLILMKAAEAAAAASACLLVAAAGQAVTKEFPSMAELASAQSSRLFPMFAALPTPSTAMAIAAPAAHLLSLSWAVAVPPPAHLLTSNLSPHPRHVSFAHRSCHCTAAQSNLW